MEVNRSRIALHTLSLLLFVSPSLFGLLIFTPPLHADSSTSPIWSIQFSLDGKHLAVGLYQWVQLWDIQARKVIRDFEPHADAVRCLKFSSDGKVLFAGGGLPAQEGEIKIWDVESGNLINTLEIHADTIEAIALHPDGSELLTAGMDEQVLVVSSPEGEVEQTLTQHVGRILAVDYRSDGKYFVTGSADKTVKVWNPQTYNVLVNFESSSISTRMMMPCFLSPLRRRRI